MNNLYILLHRANNGVALAIIACDGNPYTHLAGWFEVKGYKHPEMQADFYKVIRVFERCTTLSGAVAVLEYFDGDLVTGWEKPRVGRPEEEEFRNAK